MQHEELTRKIIGYAMRVHSEMKTGFQELIYHRALELEFKFNNLEFVSEREMDIYYRKKNR